MRESSTSGDREFLYRIRPARAGVMLAELFPYRVALLGRSLAARRAD